MLDYALRRLLSLLLTLAFASVAVFALLEWLPGDAAAILLGDSATPESLAALRAELGLDAPALQRWWAWIQGLLLGQTGTSLSYGVPTSELLAERLQLTAPLALLAMALTLLIALAAGLYAAARHRRAGDALVMAGTQLGIAVPSFWFAILLVLLFSVQLQWFSAGGFPGWSAQEGGGLWPGLQALLLPAVALAVVQAAILARVTRSALLDVLSEDYLRTARAKGLSRRQALLRHGLRNAAIPVLTVAGLQFANLLTGTIVVENVFVLPGLGRLVFQAVSNRDLVVVRDVVMLLVALVVLVNFIVDLAVAWADPRVRSA